MTPLDIQLLAQDFSGNDLYEMLDSTMVDNATVAVAFGQEEAREYASWIYCNLK